VEAFTTEETVLSLGPVSSWPKGYSSAALEAQYERFAKSARLTMPETSVFLYANFVGSDSLMAKLVQSLVEPNMGVGASNTIPGSLSSGQKVWTGVTGADYRGLLAIANSVEALELGGKRGARIEAASYGQSVAQLELARQVNSLRADVVEAFHAALRAQVGVDLARNHGHQLALTAGLAIARGDLVLVLDADLQDPPELLPKMLAQVAAGYDVVYGVRETRLGETAFKRWSAALFYRLLGRMVDIAIPPDTGDFRLMTRRVVDQLNAMPERYRFIRGMVAWVGFAQIGVRYERDARFAGETHYPLSRMLSLAFDGVTGFSTVPLRLASHLGIGFGLSGLGMLIWVMARYFAHGTVTGWASTITIILVLGSAQLLMLGMMGEYLGRMYMETKRRPLFIVREVVCAQPSAAVVAAPLARAVQQG